MLRILVIEDDIQIRTMLVKALLGAGYQTEGAENAEQGLRIHRSRPAHLIVLDLMLPAMSGHEFLKAIRPRDEVPVLILTALGQEQQRLKGFENGADDYLIKPFSPLELFARIKAILRRTRNLQEETPLLSGPFRLDCLKKAVIREAEDLDFTPTEYHILHALVSNPGQSLTRNEILHLAWPVNARPAPRTVDVHMVNLRRKLTREGDPTWILNAGPRGYCWTQSVKSVI